MSEDMGKHYPEGDVAVVAFVGKPYVPSHNKKCEKCSRDCTVSFATWDFLERKVAETGGKIHVVCMFCVPDEDVELVEMPPGQIEEIKEAGLDIEELSRQTGKSIKELTAEAFRGLRRPAQQQEEEEVTMKDNNEKKPNTPDGWADTSINDLFRDIDPGQWSKKLLYVRDMMEYLGKKLRWNDDWMPMLFVEGRLPEGAEDCIVPIGGNAPEIPENRRGIMIVPLADLMKDDTKDECAAFMYATAVATDAVGMMFVSTVWCSPGKPPESEKQRPEETDAEYQERMEDEVRNDPNYVRPSQDPEREERLMLISVYHEAGEDDGMKTCFAKIKREKGKPPKLYDWIISEGGDISWGGRFPRAIHDGLLKAEENRRKKGGEA